MKVIKLFIKWTYIIICIKNCRPGAYLKQTHIRNISNTFVCVCSCILVAVFSLLLSLFVDVEKGREQMVQKLLSQLVGCVACAWKLLLKSKTPKLEIHTLRTTNRCSSIPKFCQYRPKNFHQPSPTTTHKMQLHIAHKKPVLNISGSST